jgi:amidase
MCAAGATLDVRYPEWFLDGKDTILDAVRLREFGPQVATYLGTLGPSYPKTLDELIARSRQYVAPRPDGAMPNPSRWSLFQREAASGSVNDAEYRAVHTHVLPAVRILVDGLLQSNALDAIVYSTSPRRPVLLTEVAAGGSRTASRAWEIASLTGIRI